MSLFERTGAFKMIKFAILFAFALSVVALSSGTSTKINPALASVLKTNPTANVVISFDGTDIVLTQFHSRTFASRGEKLTTLSKSLQVHTTKSQKNVFAFLSTSGVEFKSFWVNNKIFIENARLDLVETLSTFDDVTEIREENILQLISPTVGHPSPPVSQRNEWGLVNIKAPEAWAAGFTGEGVVVSTIDSGVRYTHESLVDKFRAENGWYDPYANSETPNDFIGHGTHVTGTIVGGFNIGVAPDAQWIACKGCNILLCTEAALVGCGQWVTCPTDFEGGNSTCDLAPHLVSNSWGGGQGNPFYNEVINAWYEAGIIPIFANGNSGPFCESANSPADQDRVISVGSTNSTNGCSWFSSKGPEIVNQGIKPTVCAPGSNIRSAFNWADNSYIPMSGTSMAAPHTSGVVALMLSANPNLTYEEVEEILKEHNDRDLVPTERACGDIVTTTFPNNSFGYGKVNCLKAAQAAADKLNHRK